MVWGGKSRTRSTNECDATSFLKVSSLSFCREWREPAGNIKGHRYIAIDEEISKRQDSKGSKIGDCKRSGTTSTNDVKETRDMQREIARQRGIPFYANSTQCPARRTAGHVEDQTGTPMHTDSPLEEDKKHNEAHQFVKDEKPVSARASPPSTTTALGSLCKNIA